MKKRLSMASALVLAISMLFGPVSAFANKNPAAREFDESEYGLVFETETGQFYLDDESNTVYTGQSDKWSWDSETNTLYLDGFEWETSASVGLKITGGDLTISLSGESTILSMGSSDNRSVGIWVEGLYTLTIDGTGVLNALSGGAGAGDTSAGLWLGQTDVPFEYGFTVFEAKLVLNSGILNAMGSYNNDGKINENSCGIFNGYGITVNSGILNAVGGNAVKGSYGIHKGLVVVYGGTLNATGGDAGVRSFGILTNPLLSIFSHWFGKGASLVSVYDGKLNATGGTAGIISGFVTLYGGEFNAAGGMYGICDGSVSLYGGELNATGGVYGICDGSVSLDGDEFKTMGDAYEINRDLDGYLYFPPKVLLYIYEGVLTAQGGTGAIKTGDSFYDLSPAYTYWTNTTASHPGGDGTKYPGGPAFENSADYKYVKIDARDESEYGLVFETETGQFYLDDGDNTVYTGQDDKWSWDAETNTLYLEDFEWETSASVGLKITGGDLTISLSGENTILSGSSDNLSVGIWVDGLCTLTIDGTGTLNALSGGAGYTSIGLWLGLSVVPIISLAKLIVNGGTLNAIGSYNSEGFINANSYGINGGDITINGGIVNATGGNAADLGIGVTSTNSFLGRIVSVSITINDGTFNAIGGTYGVCNAGPVSLYGGEFTATGGICGIYGPGFIYLYGGKLNAIGGDYGIWFRNYVSMVVMKFEGLNIYGGVITAQGGIKAMDIDEGFYDLSPAYTYWTNTTTSHPGGDGTKYPGGPAFENSDEYKYVKIDARDVIDESEYGLVFDPSIGKFYLWGYDIEENYVEYTGQADKWSWDAETETLRLNGFKWETNCHFALLIQVIGDNNGNGDMIIHLTGENTFESKPYFGSEAHGIGANGSLTITGDGTLNAIGNCYTAGYNNGFSINRNFILESGTVNAIGGPAGYASSGFYAVRSIVINGGTLNAHGGEITDASGNTSDFGLAASEKIIMNDGILIASGYGQAIGFEGDRFPAVLADEYTYWMSTDQSDPGGSGITYPGGEMFINDDSYKFVKIEVSVPATPTPTPTPAENIHSLLFDQYTGLIYLDSNDSDLIDDGDEVYMDQADKWHWDAETKTLTLDGFVWETTGKFALSLERDVPTTLTLRGVNTLRSIGLDSIERSGAYGFLSVGDLTINGDGILYAYGPTEAVTTIGWGISVWNHLTIDSGTIVAIGGESPWARRYGVAAWGGGITMNGGTLIASGSSAAIAVYGVGEDYNILDGTIALTAPAYTYWTNTTASHPGGDGTKYPGGPAFENSADYKYVKIDAAADNAGLWYIWWRNNDGFNSGILLAYLSETPSVTPALADFTIEYSVNGSARQPLVINSFEPANGGQIGFRFAPFERTIEDQLITIYVTYRGVTKDFNVMLSGFDAPAALEYIEGFSSNGSFYAVFDKIPVPDPVFADFTAEYSINDSARQPLALIGYSYDTGSELASMGFTPFQRTGEEQNIRIYLTYKGVTRSFSYTLDALAPPAISKIKINLSALTSMAKGTNKDISVEITPAGADPGNIEWSSNNEKVAYVKDGKLYATETDGMAVITCTVTPPSGPVFTASIVVNVK